MKYKYVSVGLIFVCFLVKFSLPGNLQINSQLKVDRVKDTCKEDIKTCLKDCAIPVMTNTNVYFWLKGDKSGSIKQLEVESMYRWAGSLDIYWCRAFCGFCSPALYTNEFNKEPVGKEFY